MESWWFYLMDAAIVAIVVAVAFGYQNIKRGQYQKEADRCIQAEIILETGKSEFYTVPCKERDEWVTVKGMDYHIDIDHRRWGKHPRVPWLGFKSMQTDIRKETWFKDDPNPAYRAKKKLVVPGDRPLTVQEREALLLTDEERQKGVSVLTSAEVNAKTKEAAAIFAGLQANELEANQKVLTTAITNMLAKMPAYVFFFIIIALGVVGLVMQYRAGG
jgi:hypothetical protein